MTYRRRILVVEDERTIAAAVAARLHAEGFAVDLVHDGPTAVAAVRAHRPALVVLDVMLPGLDGLEVCRRLRAADERVPVLMLTARDAVPDRVAGLEMGAGDYLVKPFAFAELLARIRVRLRQRERTGGCELRFADLRLDTATREAWRGDRPVPLTTTEYGLLRLFLQHPRQVLVRDLIYERVWGYRFVGESKVIEVYVGYLRHRLEAAGEPRLIHTVRGAGYVLKEPG